jgi:hypothetical protein
VTGQRELTISRITFSVQHLHVLHSARHRSCLVPHCKPPAPAKNDQDSGRHEQSSHERVSPDLNERLNARLGGWDNGEIVIVSVNFGNIEFFVRRNRWDEAPRLPNGKIERLERGARM